MAAKTYDYIVTLKQTKSFNAFDWISQLLLFLATASFVYIAITMTIVQLKTAGFVFAALVVAGWIFGRVKTGFYGIALGIAAVGWYALLQNWLLLALYGISSILERQVKFKQEIGFDEEGVTFNSFPKKTYQWHEVSNVILKDGLLTVDLRNNKIFQKEIETDVIPMMEKEFNDFCKQYLYTKQTNSLAV